ncbi:MAG: hypothetical protein FWE85_04505 [Clostridiales bacterium]|nr:hypothetical protein [Clostridiales bacterium]
MSEYSETKKRKPASTVITAVALVAIAAVIMAILFLLPALASSSYEKAETNSFKALSQPLSSISGKGVKYEVSLEYKPGEGAREYLGDNIPDLSLNAVISLVGQKLLAEGRLTIDGDDIDATLAMDGVDISLAFPGLTDFFLRWATDPNSLTSASDLDMKKLNVTLNNIAKEYFKLADDIAVIDKNVPLSSGKVELKCDRYVMNFKEKDLMKLLISALKEVRKNNNLISYIDDNLGVYGGFANQLDEMIDSLEDELYNYRGENGTMFRMTVYVHRNQVVARTLDGFPGSDMVISYQILNDGKNMSIDAKLAESGMSYSITGDFEKKNGAWEGEAKFVFRNRVWDSWEHAFVWEDVTVNLTVEGYKPGKQPEGKFRLTYSEKDFWGDEQGFDLAVTLAKEGKKQAVTAKLIMIVDGERLDLGQFKITYAQTSISKIKMPTWNSRFAIDVNGGGENWEKMYDDLGKALDKYEDNEWMQDLIEELQWLLKYDLFWRYW